MPHKLLLADDSVTIQRVIELTFADEDVQVIAVGDGKQAINRAQQDPPDIILADVGMPERDGYEVATFIKQSPELKHIPVLLLTGAFEPIDEGRARAAGCDGVLVKPFEPQLVINRVKDLISARRSPEPQPHDVPAPPSAALAVEPEAPPAPPAAASAARPASPGAPPAGSIEDYFDRLDAAFSSLDAGAVLASPPPLPDLGFDQPPAESSKSPFGGLGDALAGWDPDISGDPSRDTPVIEPPPIEISWPGSPSLTLPPSAEPSLSAVDSFAAPREQPSAPPVSAFAHLAPAPPVSFDPPAPFKPPATPPPAPPSLAEAFAALLAAEQGRPFSPAASAQATVDDRTVEAITRRVLDRMSDRVVKETVVDLAERLVREEIDRIKSNAR